VGLDSVRSMCFGVADAVAQTLICVPRQEAARFYAVVLLWTELDLFGSHELQQREVAGWGSDE